MDTSIKAAIFFLCYFLAPFFVGALLLRWGIKKRGERPPVEFVLRRAAGESLRRKIAKMDEDMPMHMLLISILPLLAGWLVFLTVGKFGTATSLFALVLAAVILLLGMAGTCIWTLRHFKKRRNYLLGYLGERAVAEELEPLTREGYHVFHDVPVEKVEGSFNLDHVVVGPTGLFAIETKTRRKGRAREGVADHKVFYDGLRHLPGEECLRAQTYAVVRHKAKDPPNALFELRERQPDEPAIGGVQKTNHRQDG